jgi:hypothetical protein
VLAEVLISGAEASGVHSKPPPGSDVKVYPVGQVWAKIAVGAARANASTTRLVRASILMGASKGTKYNYKYKRNRSIH